MKKIFTYLFFVIFFQNSFSQIPIGKDFNLGKQELKLFMKNSGFHFLKEIPYKRDDGKRGTELLFKEEITISIEKNEYDNIQFIHIWQSNSEGFQKLLKCYKFDQWKFLYYETNVLGRYDYYQLENCYAILLRGEQLNFKKSLDY